MFPPLTNWLTRQWENQGSHFNAGWPPSIMTSSMVTLRPPSHLKLNQCKGKWLNKKAGRTTCTIIASMNFKNKHTSNNNIIRSSWLHTKLHDLVTKSWAANSMNGSGKGILNDMSCRSFLVLGCDIFFHQVWMENEWSMVAHESMRSNFAQGTTQMLQGLPTNPGTRTSVDGSIRLLPPTAAHWQTPCRLHKTADWQQRPWSQIHSQYMISGLIRLCQTSFIQNVFAFSSKHWTENQSPTEVNWQSCWLIGDHVAKACNASETLVQGSGPHKLWMTLIFLIFLQHNTADYSRQ